MASSTLKILNMCIGLFNPSEIIRYNLKEFASRNNPPNASSVINLTHFSLRVTVESTFYALKIYSMFLPEIILPLRHQVKLVLARCILRNWILGFGLDDLVPEESDLTPDLHQYYG